MTIDYAHFTALASLLGGVIIGLAASMFVLFNGRVAGISGIVGGLLRGGRPNVSWRLAFIAGLVPAPLAYGLFAKLPTIRIEASTEILILAGLLVGLGTQYSAGCTSGHGVCGLSRFSLRSLAATASFMGAGFFTVFLWRHCLG
jgi:uncharacterized protein